MLATSFLLAACGGGGDTAVDESTEAQSADDDAGATEDDAGATESADADTASQDLGTVTVVNGVAQTFEFLPQQLGHELGVWEERGLQVEDLLVRGGGQVGQTMAAGEADIALTTASSVVQGTIGGLDAAIIGEVGREFTLMVLCVGPESDVQGPEDMEGTTIGITSLGSGTDFLAEQLATSQGWTTGSQIQKAPIGGLEEQVAALSTGTVDGFIWTAEACFQLEEQDEGRVVFSFGDIVEGNVFEILAASGQAIEERPEPVQAYLEGWYETVEYMKDNKDAVIEFMVTEWELSENVAEQTYDLDIDNLSSDGVIPEENLEGLAESLVTIGAAEEAPEPSSFYDDRFVPVSLES